MRPIHTISALALAAGLGLTALPSVAQDTATTPDPSAEDTGTSDTGTSGSTSSDAGGSGSSSDATSSDTMSTDAGEGAGGGASEEELREAAGRYIESDGVQKMMDSMFSPEMMTSMMQSQAGGSIPPDELEQVSQVVSEVLEDARPDMEEAMVTAAAETFTLPEIEAQIEFYQSPEGASVMSKMQPFMTTFNEAAAPAMQAMQQELMTRLSEVMQPEE